MGYNTIKECIEFNKEQEEKGKQEMEKPEGNCPYCEWPLSVNSQGQKSCPICERIWR